MANSEAERAKRSLSNWSVKAFGRDGRGKGRGIGLELRGLLALSEMRAGRAAVVLVKEVVDQVERKSDQVRGKQGGRQGARSCEPPGATEPSVIVVHHRYSTPGKCDFFRIFLRG